MAQIKAVVSSVEIDGNLGDPGTSVLVRGRYVNGSTNPEFGIKVPIASNWWILGIFNAANVTNSIALAVIDCALRDHFLVLTSADVLLPQITMG